MPRPTSESARIADQLRRAFEGAAWHGPALLELLDDVDAATAAAKALPNVHSIWELVLHVAVWDAAACRRLAGGNSSQKARRISRWFRSRRPKWRGARLWRM